MLFRGRVDLLIREARCSSLKSSTLGSIPWPLNFDLFFSQERLPDFYWINIVQCAPV